MITPRRFCFLSFILISSQLFALEISKEEYTKRIDLSEYVAIEVFETQTDKERSYAIVSINTSKIKSKKAYWVSTGRVTAPTPKSYFTFDQYAPSLYTSSGKKVDNFFSFYEGRRGLRYGLFTYAGQEERAETELGGKTTLGGIRFSSLRGAQMIGQIVRMRSTVGVVLAVYGANNPPRELTQSDRDVLSRDLKGR